MRDVQPISSSNEVKYSKFIAFGNALLDHSAIIPTDEILSQYHLDRNAEGELSIKKLTDVIRYVKKCNIPILTHPGGSAVNTCRTLFALGEPDVCLFGAVGDDENGWKLNQKLTDCGVQTCFQIINDQMTGTCICLIHEDSRSCYANIGASRLFEQSFLEAQLESLLMPNRRQIIYVEGFFVSDRFSICKYIHETACQNNPSKEFVVNLSSKYIITENQDEMKYLAKCADIVIGSLNQFQTLSLICGYEKLDECIQYLSAGNCFKIIVITNGGKPVDLYCDRTGTGNMSKTTYNVPILSTSEIVDTTGAGDSFVAGFFWAYLRQKSLAECVENGNSAAARTIRTVGGSFVDHRTKS